MCARRCDLTPTVISTCTLSRAAKRRRLQRDVRFRDPQRVFWVFPQKPRHLRQSLWQRRPIVAAVGGEPEAMSIEQLHLRPLLPIGPRGCLECPAHRVRLATALWASWRGAITRRSLETSSTLETRVRDEIPQSHLAPHISMLATC